MREIEKYDCLQDPEPLPDLRSLEPAVLPQDESDDEVLRMSFRNFSLGPATYNTEGELENGNFGLEYDFKFEEDEAVIITNSGNESEEVFDVEEEDEFSSDFDDEGHMVMGMLL